MISFNGHVLMWLYKPYGVTYDDTHITTVYLETLSIKFHKRYTRN